MHAIPLRRHPCQRCPPRFGCQSSLGQLEPAGNSAPIAVLAGHAQQRPSKVESRHTLKQPERGAEPIADVALSCRSRERTCAGQGLYRCIEIALPAHAPRAPRLADKAGDDKATESCKTPSARSHGRATGKRWHTWIGSELDHVDLLDGGAEGGVADLAGVLLRPPQRLSDQCRPREWGRSMMPKPSLTYSRTGTLPRYRSIWTFAGGPPAHLIFVWYSSPCTTPRRQRDAVVRVTRANPPVHEMRPNIGRGRPYGGRTA